MTAAAARTCETAHVQRRQFIFPRAIFDLLKRPLFHIFKSFFCKIYFSAIFPLYPGTIEATSKKNQVQRCFRFPGILLSDGQTEDGGMTHITRLEKSPVKNIDFWASYGPIYMGYFSDS